MTRQMLPAGNHAPEGRASGDEPIGESGRAVAGAESGDPDPRDAGHAPRRSIRQPVVTSAGAEAPALARWEGEGGRVLLVDDASARDRTSGDDARSGGAPSAPGGAEPREVVVHGSASAFVQTITVGRHQLVADEPAGEGGSDRGPTPYDLLISALGACTSMTVSLYARRKRWPLEGVTVRLRHYEIHAADCAACETKEGKLDRIECDVELQGALTEEQRARLVEIARKCPVHRTLSSELEIVTQPRG